MFKQNKKTQKGILPITGILFLIIFSIFITALIFSNYFQTSPNNGQEKGNETISEDDRNPNNDTEESNKQGNNQGPENETDESDTDNPDNAPPNNGIETPDTLTLDFQSKGDYQVRFNGQNNSQNTNLFDYEIEEANYKNAETLQANVYEDYDGGSWGDYLFYLPANDQYYLFSPSSSATFRVISNEELQQEFMERQTITNEDGSINKKECTLTEGEFLENSCYLLKCSNTYSFENKQDPDLSYVSTSTNTSWLYELDEDNFLMYRVLSSPAGSEVDSREGHEMNGVEGIEIL
jgi:hypothetical protein